MKRLTEENKNTVEEYNKIFIERAKKEVDEQDFRRWKKLLSKFRGGKILDIGCLDSLIPSLAKQMYPDSEAWGIDTADKAIEIMQALHPSQYYETRDLYDTKFDNEYFDYAVMGEVLEHLEEPAKAVKEAVRILKPGGILAISVPLNEAKEPGAVDHIHHLLSYSASDIINLVKPYGSVQKCVIGSQYFPKYVYHWPTIIAFLKKK